jgi:hypothetical protein
MGAANGRAFFICRIQGTPTVSPLTDQLSEFCTATFILGMYIPINFLYFKAETFADCKEE